jgi:hypothetical protein
MDTSKPNVMTLAERSLNQAENIKEIKKELTKIRDGQYLQIFGLLINFVGVIYSIIF